ncbi:MAG TPA: hypothetical protein VJ326_09015 [Thermoplasmata archaeon]|nr:hypothetical protein [Thermoplasmata archaeon]
MNPEELNEVVLHNSFEQLRLQEVQLLLSEKRTSLSTLRTGIAVLALPLSVVSFLVATSQMWDILEVLYLMAPLLAFCASLVGVGSYLVMRAVVRIQTFDRKIEAISREDDRVRDLVRID